MPGNHFQPQNPVFDPLRRDLGSGHKAGDPQAGIGLVAQIAHFADRPGAAIGGDAGQQVGDHRRQRAATRRREDHMLDRDRQRAVPQRAWPLREGGVFIDMRGTARRDIGRGSLLELFACRHAGLRRDLLTPGRRRGRHQQNRARRCCTQLHSGQTA